MYRKVNIHTALAKSGEEKIQQILSTFSCSNKEVQEFIRNKAVDFAKRRLSITYLVFSKDNDLVGVFTLANKFARIPAKEVSNTVKSQIRKFAVWDEADDSYITSAILVAQFGKSDIVPKEKNIRGDELMAITMDVIQEVQQRVGGKLVWLECEEENERAQTFYEHGHYKFHQFAKRDASDGTVYIQMLKLI